MQLHLLKFLFFGRATPEDAPVAVHRRNGIAISFLEGAWAQVWITLTAGKFLVDLIRHLGGGDLEIALISAVPFLFGPAQLLGAYLCTHFGSRKKVILVSAFINRQIWWLAVPLILLPLDSSVRFGLFFLMYLVSQFAGQITNNTWLSWTADLLPTQLRGRIIGARNALILGIATLADFGASAVRDGFGEAGRTAALALIFGVAAFAALVSVNLFRRQWEPPLASRELPPLRKILGACWRNADVKRLQTAVLLWSFAVGVGGPFFTPFMMDDLELSFIMILWYTLIVSGLSMLMNAFFWGHIVDKAGTLPVLLGNGLVIGCLPLLYLFITPEDLSLYWFDAVVTGIAWSGFNVALFNLPLQVVPLRDRAYYLAITSMVGGIGMGAGNVLGGFVANAIGGSTLDLFGYAWNNYQVMFILTTVLRYGALLLFLRVPDRRNRGMFVFMQELGEGVQRLVTAPRSLLLLGTRSPKRRRRRAAG
ncbi:MAG: MFS transporter [Candidatus Sumerlaeia bacterium]|nr:MFS transporter [Candidatus Sumerlaeia bacterium]